MDIVYVEQLVREVKSTAILEKPLLRPHIAKRRRSSYMNIETKSGKEI